MSKIEKTFFNIQSQSMKIDDSCIHIEESYKHRFNISNLPPICKTIEGHGESFAVIASNDRFLLTHQNGKLCLVDQTFSIVQETLWNGVAYMICAGHQS